MGPRKSLHAHAPGHHGAEGQRRRCRGCSCNAWERPVGVTKRARYTPRRPVSEGVLLNIVRRALTTAAIGSTAVAGVAVIGATAAQAAKLIPTSLSISAPHQVTYWKPATVTGVLTNTGTHKPVSGVTVQLRERRPGASKWTWVPGTATTKSNGSVSLSTLPLTTTEQVQLVASKTAATQAATSGVGTIKVAYAVTAALSNNTVTVTVAPSAAHQTVQLQLRKPGETTWSTVQTGKLGAGSATTFTIKPPKAKGTYSYRVVKPASGGFLQGTSTTPMTLVVG